MTRETTTQPLFKKVLFGILAGFLSLAFLLLCGEFLVRLKRHSLFDTSNVRERYLKDIAGRAPASHDPLLGYVPRPGSTLRYDGRAITVNAQTLRTNGDIPAGRGGLILAVGDSFTWGDGVSDNETWPACLQATLSRPVVNGGVFGYGFDQTVLRAEKLVPLLRPQLLLASLIPSDVYRCGLSYRNVWKPYFDIQNSSLVLKNVPVPASQRKDPQRWLFDCLGYSHLADYTFRALASQWWFESSLRQVAHARHEQVASLLVDRLAQLARASHCGLILVIQAERSIPTPGDTMILPVIRRAQELGVPMIDLMPLTYSLFQGSPELEGAFWHKSHMSKAGNAWVAKAIATRLVDMEPLFKDGGKR